MCGLALAVSPRPSGFFSAARAAEATTYYWTTGSANSPVVAGSGTWSSGAPNWETSPTGSSLTSWVGGSADTADFYANGTSTISVNGNQTVGSITFDGSGYTLIGGTLTLGTGTITTNQDATITCALAGGAGLVKAGTGTLTLAGNNAQTGGLTVNGGIVAINVAQSYSGPTTIAAGATLRVNAIATSLPTIAGLDYQLDASNTTNLTIGAGNAVSGWNDSSGNGVNFMQNAAGVQPIYSGSGINGLGAVSFTNGGASALDSLLVAGTTAAAQTVFIVNTPSASNGSLAEIWGTNFGLNNGIRTQYGTSWRNGPAASGPPGDFTYSGGSMALNGGALNGSTTLSFTAGQPQVLEAVAVSAQGGSNCLGWYANYDGPPYYSDRAYTGLIGEVVAYSGTLTSAQQAAVNNYLEAKWLGASAVGGVVGGSNLLPSTTPVTLTGAGATLDLGAGNETIASISGVAGSAVVQEAGVLTVGGDNSSTTFAGSLNGSGGLVKTGSGALTLNGANSYTGGTTISSGTLMVNGSLAAASPLAVNSGATLAGIGSVGGVTVNSGGHVAPGNGGVGTLTASSLTLQSGSVLDYQFGSGGGNGLINVTSLGGLTINGGGINLYNQGSTSTFASPGTYTLMNYVGPIGGNGASALTVLNQQPNTTYSFGAYGGATTLTIGPYTPPAAPPINPSNPPSTLANNTFVFGLKPSFAWTPLTEDLGFQLAIPGLTAFSFSQSYSTFTYSPTIPAWQYQFKVPNWTASTIAAVTFQNSFSLSLTAGVEGAISGEASVTLTNSSLFATVDANLGLTADAYVQFPLPGIVSSVVSKVPSLASVVPNPVKLPLSLDGLPDLDTGTIPVLIGTQAFSFTQFASNVAGILECSPSSLTTFTTSVLVPFGATSVPMTFDPKDGTVTLTIGASCGLDLHTSVTASLNASLQRATSGTVSSASAPLAAAVVPINVSQCQCFPSTAGTAQINANNSITMDTGDPVPVWMSISVSSTNTIGAVLFDAQFSSSDTGDGTLSVYLGGNLIGLVSEATAGHNQESYLFPLNSTLPPGSYQLSYRLDNSSNSEAAALISDCSLVSTPTVASWALATSGNWSNSGNWAYGVAPNAIGAGAVLDASTTASLTITLDAPQTVGTLMLGNSASATVGYTLIGSGTNTLTFNNSGNGAAITVANGTHVINAPVVLADNLMVMTGGANPWTLSFGTASSITDNGNNFSLTMSASNGTLILNGTNTYGGGTFVNQGNLVFSSTSAIPSSGSIQINATGAVNISGAYTTASGWIGSGKINPNSTGALALTGQSNENINFSGYNTLSLGAAGNETYTGTITPAGSGYNLGGGGGMLVYNGPALTGSNSLTINGNVTFSTAQSYSGATTISAGTLQLAGGGNLLPAATALTIASGGVLDLDGSNQTVGSLSGLAGAIVVNNSSGTNTSTLTVNLSSGATTFAGNIIGNTLLAISGGELTLSGTDTYTGGTTVSGGTLDIAVPSALSGSGLVTIAAGGRLVFGDRRGHRRIAYGLVAGQCGRGCLECGGVGPGDDRRI